MNQINLFNQTKIDTKEIDETVINVFKINEVKETFSIIFVTKKGIKKLNKTYRGINKVTDVLSFTNEEKDYIGDIFICLKQAIKQAKDYNHCLKREVSFLAVHGYLHLLGYDHQNKEDEDEMIQKQNLMLDKANIKRDNK